MPYYDQDGRELSGRNDPSARGEWIYTDDGGKVRSESARRQEVGDSITSNRRSMAPSTPRYDEAGIVLWFFGFILFTLPLKAIQLVLWSGRIGWRWGGATYRFCDHALGVFEVRRWLAAPLAMLAATLVFTTVTIGLVAYVVMGIVAFVGMDTNLMTLWLVLLVIFIGLRLT